MRNATDTITVWNRWYDPIIKKEVWYRSIVPDCFYRVETIRAVDSSGTAVIASVHIAMITENDKYVSPEKWHGIAGTFTLQVGDYVVHGKVSTEETSISAIKKAYRGFEIKSVVDNTQGYKQGRHYEIRGV